MNEITADEKLIAYCCLYCGSCGKYKKGKCPGCIENEKAGWCKVRACCIEHSYRGCAECDIFENVRDCKKLNNLISKLFSLVFRSDMPASIDLIKEKGYDVFVGEMAEKGIMTPRK